MTMGTGNSSTTRIGRRSVTGTAADKIFRFVKGHRSLYFFASWGSKTAALSRFPVIRTVLGPLRDRLRGNMSADDVLSVVDALQGAAVHFWVAGGWGVDALLGEQTRSHQDVDIVIGDFERCEPEARSVLQGLGFQFTETRTHETWMPLCSALDDRAGHRIELLSMDRERLIDSLRGTSRHHPETEGRHSGSVEGATLFTQGTIAGRAVPCLSAQVQLLYHSGYELTPELEQDVARLESLQARSNGPDGASD
jgi:lincosamide nucleotidyltransferase A/C/D/E